jgi:Uma2 family endonuclease
MATVTDQIAVEFVNVGQLLEFVPGVPPGRIRLIPTPGEATEEDVVRLWHQHKILCELVDGVLVEKPMGFQESVIASRISMYLSLFVQEHDLGVVAGESGMLRIAAGRVRMPDVSYLAWEQLPNRHVPTTPILGAHPDLAVEVLSLSNTDTEMTRKIAEYFASGTQLVWIVDPPARTVTIYSSPENGVLLNAHQSLSGGDFLPGFELAIEKIFHGLS